MIRYCSNHLTGRWLPYRLTLELELIRAIGRHQKELVRAACMWVACISGARAFFVQANIIVQNRQSQDALGLALEEGV
jgi:hypothetical protein